MEPLQGPERSKVSLVWPGALSQEWPLFPEGRQAAQGIYRLSREHGPLHQPPPKKGRFRLNEAVLFPSALKKNVPPS